MSHKVCKNALPCNANVPSNIPEGF